MTDLKRCVDDLERLGPATRRASAFFRRCIRDYDMDSILRALSAPEAVDAAREPVAV